MADFSKFNLKFSVDGTPKSFSVVTDLERDELVLAFNSWIYRTKKYTAKSLCNYINSKSDMTCNVAVTMKEYEEIKNSD